MAGLFSEQQNEFYRAYDVAMAFWASVEAELGDYFIRITGMPESMGYDVFYSARSFLGRADIVGACIAHARVVPDARKFLVRSVKIARSWSSARNRLAHDHHAIEIAEPGQGLYPALKSSRGEITTTKQIQNAAANFFMLDEILHVSHGQQKLVREPELCLLSLALLPADALATAADRAKLAPLKARIAYSED